MIVTIIVSVFLMFFMKEHLRYLVGFPVAIVMVVAGTGGNARGKKEIRKQAIEARVAYWEIRVNEITGETTKEFKWGKKPTKNTEPKPAEQKSSENKGEPVRESEILREE